MQLLEPIETLNQRLADYFGIDTVTGMNMYRIVLADEQFEMRLTDCTDAGILLLKPEVRKLPKYQWLKGLYLIETLCIVPVVNADTLPDQKLSYEPLFVFWDKNQQYLPPKWEVAELVISSVLAAKGKSSLARYTDGINSQEEAEEAKRKRIDEMVEYFAGDESGLMGNSLNSGSAAFVPHNYEKSN
jgi:hypothetical protein